MTLIERIGKYVDEIAPGQPILAGDIFTHVAKAGFTQRDVFNEYLTRYLDTHPDFLRYRRGIYYKTVQTPFGIRQGQGGEVWLRDRTVADAQVGAYDDDARCYLYRDRADEIQNTRAK